MAEQAQEMVVDATPKKKAFMDKRSTHEERIKKDEEEPKNAEERTFKKRWRLTKTLPRKRKRVPKAT